MTEFDELIQQVQEEGLKHTLMSGLVAGALALSPSVSKGVITTPKIQEVQKSYTPEDIIAATLIGEAGGEGNKGMQAVLNIILNRANNNIPKASEVCLKPKQFSMWNSFHGKEKVVIDKAKKHPKWSIAVYMVNYAKTKKVPDLTYGAKFYFNPKIVKPSWAKAMKKTATIGHHDFYKL